MRVSWLFLLASGWWLLSHPAAAQQAPTDVLILRNGTEQRGRVLTLTPTEVGYFPAPDSAGTPHPDTLRLPVSALFMIRYANGTRALLATPASPPAQPSVELLGLNHDQRQQLGQADARRSYHRSGPYWGMVGSSVYLGPVLGLVPAIAIGSSPVRAHNLLATSQLPLNDADYALGYQQQANRTKRGRVWAGYATGVGLHLLLIAALLASYSR